MENYKVKKVFRSRISVLLVGFLLVVFIPVTVPIIKFMIISGLLTMGGSFLFIILLFSGIRYIISDGKLFVKIWFITIGSANIADIVSIKRSYNLLSSPAASLKRLELRGRSGAMLISPVREREFIESLKTINPDINVDVPVKTGIWRIQDWDI
jgi:predicted ABC-type sugar transport system permease subunit